MSTLHTMEIRFQNVVFLVTKTGETEYDCKFFDLKIRTIRNNNIEVISNDEHNVNEASISVTSTNLAMQLIIQNNSRHFVVPSVK